MQRAGEFLGRVVRRLERPEAALGTEVEFGAPSAAVLALLDADTAAKFTEIPDIEADSSGEYADHDEDEEDHEPR